MKKSYLFTLGLLFGTLAAFGQGFPNVPQTPGTLLTPLLEHMQGRTAIIEWHNGWIYTSPESPDSLPGSDILARRWDLSDLSNVHVEEILGVSPGAVAAHGSIKFGDALQLGGNGSYGESWMFRAVSPGVNERVPVLEAPNGIGVRGSVYFPWLIDPTFWSYSPVEGNVRLSFRGEELANWDLLGDTGVIGHPFLIGNLLIFASDQTRTGVATYDISDPTNPVLLDVLKTGGPGGYWPELWGGNGHLYVVFPYRRAGHGMRVVDVTDPTDMRFLADVELPGAEPMYIQFQDEYAFLGSHKVDMRTFESVLSLDTQTTGVDTSQYLLPLGNLLVTGGAAPNQGMAVWAHQAEPDLRGPSVGYHIPRAGQANYPLGAPITLLIHETLESPTITVGENLIVRPLGGEAVTGTVVLAFDDILTFQPDVPLLPDTTYEVVIPEGGITDAVGNGIEGYSFTFSTGGVVGGNTPPSVDSFTAAPYPVEPGGLVSFEAAVSDVDLEALEVRFDFGDGSPRTEWGTDLTTTYTYTEEGHYQAKAQVRDASGVIATRTFSVKVVNPLPAGGRPANSSQVVVDEMNRRIWAVNPDNNTVRWLDADTLDGGLEIPVSADPRSVAVDDGGNAWVVSYDTDLVSVLNTTGVTGTIPLDYGSGPIGIVLSPDGAFAYVSCQNSGEVLQIDVATQAVVGSVAVGLTPRALAINADGSRVYVTRFLSGLYQGNIWEVDTSTMTVSRTLLIHKFGGRPHRDSTAEGKGVANTLTGLALSPDGTQLIVTGNKMNVDRGTLNDEDLDSDNTVRNIIAIFDVASGQMTDALDIDNSDSASAVAFSTLGDYFFVALQGNNQVAVFDRLIVNRDVGLGGLVTRHSVGLAPQGVAFDPATGRAWVKNLMSRSVTALEMSDLLQTGALSIDSSMVSTVQTEVMSPEVLLGKQVFYNAEDPRMSPEGYISCATCHLDGGHDGRVWDFTGRGDGLRNTVTLRGRSGLGHGNVHWSANFDEIQDFENDIRKAFGGEGFLTNLQFEETQNPIGSAKTGLSPELDALAAYLTSLGDASIPRSPHRGTDGSLTVQGLSGAQVFANLQCASCHSGSEMTDASAHDVGTLRSTSGGRLGVPIQGIETPTLRGLWNTAPYLHDGSAETLEDVFVASGGNTFQAESAQLTEGAILRDDEQFGVYFNYDRTVRGRALVDLFHPGNVTFTDVDGGSGGLGAVELRVASGSNVQLLVRVNGEEQTFWVPTSGNVPGWMPIVWRVFRLEGFNLLPGPVNTVEVETVAEYSPIGLDEITVITPDHMQAAQTHRQVLDLPTENREALMDYLLQLDGSPVENGPSASPRLVIQVPDEVALEGFSDRTLLEFKLTANRPVVGLDAGDIQLGGNALPTGFELIELNPGRTWQINVQGMQYAGSITLEVADEAAMDLDGLATVGTGLTQIQWQPFMDDLAPLSDEFDDASSLTQWLRLNDVEGWNADQLEQWDVDGQSEGHMRMTPHSSTWYMNNRGPLAFKEITGDFVITTRVSVSRRNDEPGRPSSAWSIGGLMIRMRKETVSAGPTPEQPSNVRLNWPPDIYSSDWVYDEDHLTMTMGSPFEWMNPDANQWFLTVSRTAGGYTSNYWGPTGVPHGVNDAVLQAVRIGSTILFMRKHGDGPWILQDRFERPDFPETLQVGILTATDYQAILDHNLFAGQFGLEAAYHHNRNVISPENGFTANPGVVVDTDYMRFSRPPEFLTQSMLQEVGVTGEGTTLSLLEGTLLEDFLGDPLNVAYEPPAPDPAVLSIEPVLNELDEGDEGNVGMTFRIVRSGNLSITSMVDYGVTGGGAHPVDGSDFLDAMLPTGQVEFLPGESEQIIQISIQGDVTAEFDEGLSVLLQNPSDGTSIISATAVGVIGDDDSGITQQPLGGSFLIGTDVELQVGAQVPATPSYQWFHQGEPLADENSAVLMRSNIQQSDAGLYHVEISDGERTFVSDAVSLSVRGPQMLSAPTMMPNGMIRLTFGDSLGGEMESVDAGNFVVQQTTDFVQWTDLEIVPVWLEGQFIVEVAQAEQGMAFYRVTEVVE